MKQNTELDVRAYDYHEYRGRIGSPIPIETARLMVRVLSLADTETPPLDEQRIQVGGPHPVNL